MRRVLLSLSMLIALLATDLSASPGKTVQPGRVAAL